MNYGRKSAVVLLSFFLSLSYAEASVIKVEMDFEIVSNYTLLNDGSAVNKLGGVYNDFGIGDIYTATYTFDSSQSADCLDSGSMIICSFYQGAMVELTSRLGNIGNFDYSSLNGYLDLNFVHDKSPDFEDVFSWRGQSSGSFIENYDYQFARTHFSGFGLLLSHFQVGSNTLGSIFSNIDNDVFDVNRGMSFSFLNDEIGETGIIGTDLVGTTRVSISNPVPEPKSFFFVALGLIGLVIGNKLKAA
ncbi:hypothetical protein AHAT_07710 [Agarivorans sp. Toyoura001]|uniref:hypothetical protein n=1 Tax=Agarivorans sp. Toyoura001 TaxID=2283141 RepID=UPI0010E145FD|nr:hypothetical protein [Agarivorans sp. Toyoura001]GDY24881.1 hypothetical protein AHAT_07710 [Agarivorans sp. Toyoura001]